MKQSPTRTIILGIVGIIALIFFGQLINKYILNSQAAEKKVNIEIHPNSGKVPEESISFILTPEEGKISAADIKVNVENGTFIGWEDCDSLTGGESSLFSDLISNATGSHGRKSCVILKSDAELPDAVVLKGTVACLNDNPIKVTIDTVNSQVVGTVSDVEYAFGSVDTAEFDCTDSSEQPEGNGDITATFTPDSCTGDVGDTCTYNLNISARNQQNKVSGYYVKLGYDKDVLKGTSFNGRPATATGVRGLMAQSTAVTPTPGTNTNQCQTDQDCITRYCSPVDTQCAYRCDPATFQCVSGGAAPTAPAGGTTPRVPAPTRRIPVPTGISQESCSVVGSNIDNANGVMELLYTCDHAASRLPTSFSNTLSLEALANGSGNITIESIQVVGPGKTAYTVDKTTAAYNIGGGADGNIDLKMKLRFQCMPQKPKAKEKMTVKVGLREGGLGEPRFIHAEFTVDDKGHWNGTPQLNAPAGDDYCVLVKGPLHMQEKVCVESPTEDFPGAHRSDGIGKISLKDGENILDFSNIVLLTGDLPDQDQISNAYDHSLVRNCIGENSEECLANTDINGDGVTNAVDNSCMIAALSVKFDEE